MVGKAKNVKKMIKKRIKRIKTQKNKDIDEESQDDDDWICKDCVDPWDEDGEDCWIICDLRGSKFHFQCYVIQYRTSQYSIPDLDNIYFECDECIVAIIVAICRYYLIP